MKSLTEAILQATKENYSEILSKRIKRGLALKKQQAIAKQNKK